MNRSMQIFCRVLLTVALLLPLSQAQAQLSAGKLTAECGATLENGYGPFDYTNPEHFREKLPIVEQLHFDAKVESLEAGINQELPGADIDYTLRAFPNHYRALHSMARYQLQYPNKLKPPNTNYSADCFFKRAMVFRPEDGVVRMIYAIYLSKRDKTGEAIEQMKAAEELQPESAEVHYNLGLLYIRAREYSAARQHAHRAYELGYPLPGLRKKLEAAGEWQSPLAAADETQ